MRHALYCEEATMGILEISMVMACASLIGMYLTSRET
jgi:hypothetical protein